MAAALALPVAASAAPAGAAQAASNCFVNGQPQPGPEIYGTAGDDDIRRDRLVSGDVVFGHHGDDTIRVTFNHAGVINGGNGQLGRIHGDTGDEEIQVLLNDGEVDGGPGNDVCRVNEGIVLNCNP
ncbi:hypothetical protein RB200_39290 [Streptomyces sp. PmtG]